MQLPLSWHSISLGAITGYSCRCELHFRIFDLCYLLYGQNMCVRDISVVE
jgi:hypothetical protein